MRLIDWIAEIGWGGCFDILLIALLIYMILIWFKKTRSAFVLKGILIVAGVYLFALQFNLVMTAGLFEMFFAVALFLLVVIFQEEIRHFFEQVAVISFDRNRWKKIAAPTRGEIDILVRAAMDFARERVGALIVIRGDDVINRHLEGEVDLNGDLSEPLLKSLFDPHSIGHDGAVLIEGNRITHFACHLPLSRNLKKLKSGGTRHAAALGISELSNALSIVVSEERGTISIAQNGTMEEVDDPEKLEAIISAFYEKIYPRRHAGLWKSFFEKNTAEKIYAVLVALFLWVVLVHGSKITYQTYTVPVSLTELPASWAVEAVEPGEVDIALRGPRRAFYFITNNSIALSLHPQLKEGKQEVAVFLKNFTVPKSVQLEMFDPEKVDIRLAKRVEPNGGKEQGQ